MKTIVTGGCGFIGGHLVDELINNGHDVTVIDDLSANNDEFYFNNKAQYYKETILNKERLNELFFGADYCFHLAAESRLQTSIENPTKTVEVNVLGTMNVLEAAKKHSVKGIIFSSTSSIYGLTKKFPIKENTKQNCLNPYASSKYSAELLLKNYYDLYGIKSCILRYFNVFGERAPTKGPYALVTGIFLRQKNNKEPLTVVGDGTQKRDFIYVKDVAKANIKCIDLWNNKKPLTNSSVFNIGFGQTVKILDLAKKISNDIQFIPKRKGEACSNLCSNDKFCKLTGWKPNTHIFDWI